MLFSGSDADYLNVAIKEGGIIVTLNLGSGSWEQEVKPGRGEVRFDDNEWHTLIISRESREVGIMSRLSGLICCLSTFTSVITLMITEIDVCFFFALNKNKLDLLVFR